MAAMKSIVAGNRLLAGLPDGDRGRMLAACDAVELAVAQVLCASGARLRHVYFPTGAFVSLVASYDGGAGLQMAMIGEEGMLGISLLLGVSVARYEQLVQGTGSALRMTAASFQLQLEHIPTLRRRLNRYAHVQMHQIAMTAACTRFHLVEERLACWLLVAQDRSGSNEIHATHQYLASILGVRRVGITNAAISLQKQSLIRYSRGNITILDRRGLKARACGCYVAANRFYDGILG